MDRKAFRDFILSRLVVLDGATGTELIKRGMPQGVCPDAWVLDNPETILDVQTCYRNAGSDIVYTCTFGSNPYKLAEFGLENEVHSINKRQAELSRQVMGSDGLVFGDIAPTGLFIEPFGETPFEDVVNAYKKQVEGLLAGGVDGFVIETMMDIQEARAALLAVRESCDLPTIVTMTYGEDGRTLNGTDPVAALVTLQSLGADAVGCNCSTGPQNMLQTVLSMRPYATVPLLAKPNAGMPRLTKDNQTVFDMGAEEFGTFVEAFINAGVCIMGGCCGTTPDHIAAVKENSTGKSVLAPAQNAISAVSSAQKITLFGLDRPVNIIGERINPTGKKKLKEELRAGQMSLVRQFALEQQSAGADLLDVNMGVSGIDEKGMMLEAVRMLSKLVDPPLCIDTTDPAVMEAALRIYPGRALVNSISAETSRIEHMLPIAAKYGAMLIVLPLSDEGIPETAEARIPLVKQIRTETARYGYHNEDLVVDGLVMAVSADQKAARETLSLVEWCAKEQGLNTTVGLSNVSFGLPQREWINAAFLSMLIDRGLTSMIANPSTERIVSIKRAADVLAGRDKMAERYVRHFANVADEAAPTKKAERSAKEQLFDCVLQGDKDNIATIVEKALEDVASAQDLVDGTLIPAITKVGDLFDQKTYFLPQLLMGADAMKAAFDHLEPHLQKEAGGNTQAKATIVLATVKGDIHDIGKNLVGLMLKNYGFRVIDLGKDISAEEIVQAAKEHNADIIGLSALMTTTMTEMGTVIEQARSAGLTTKFMVGGAVVDQAFADSIGADGYSEDAIGAVRLATKLTAPA